MIHSVRTPRGLSMITLGLGLILAQGCVRSSQACATSAGCTDGKVCVAGTCREAKEVPTAATAQRLILEATDLAVVSSSGPRPHDGAELPFGKESMGNTVLLVRFPTPFRDTTQILTAHLVLSPTPGAIPGPAPVQLRLARILEPWTSRQARWATLPRMSSVESNHFASTWGNRSLRLDVTQQVRRFRHRAPEDHGLAVLAAPQNEVGASYSLGLTGGRAPYLDVYLR